MYRPRSRPCRANGKIKSGAPRRAVGDGKGLCSRDAVRLDLDALAKREAGCRVRYSAERVIDLHGRGAQELHDDVAAIQVQRARSADGGKQRVDCKGHQRPQNVFLASFRQVDAESEIAFSKKLRLFRRRKSF
jgi:hypothetical protein